MLDRIDIKDICDVALEAGEAVMEIYKEDFLVEFKEDNSPLTQADIKANEIICSFLEKHYAHIPIISEENQEVPYEVRKNWEYFWCIDPIDGTKEFVKKNGEFTVNIALIHKDTPVLGVVFAPALGKLYYAKKGEGAFGAILNDKFLILNEERLPIVVNNKDAMVVMASNSHLSEKTKEFINNLTFKIQNSKLIRMGSSLKLCMIATDEANIYPRLSPTMEWDTAAADAIVRESGKMTYQYHSNFDTQNPSSETPLIYNKENLLNPWFVVV
ncbi:MAG: 3'(2'),5'-bisphosphate nucleotidase CysQ [Sulfurimonadaceae bacterium]|jgi:3'(2'), 5'-bisphosphate nucleotidase|nr:3'(2'),5'-bisphosphate nucleotidase CysQ [Sulfurimonadaceae bacterium]